jgi:hypothetical protein
VLGDGIPNGVDIREAAALLWQRAKSGVSKSTRLFFPHFFLLGHDEATDIEATAAPLLVTVVVVAILK